MNDNNFVCDFLQKIFTNSTPVDFPSYKTKWRSAKLATDMFLSSDNFRHMIHATKVCSGTGPEDWIFFKTPQE